MTHSANGGGKNDNLRGEVRHASGMPSEPGNLLIGDIRLSKDVCLYISRASWRICTCNRRISPFYPG